MDRILKLTHHEPLPVGTEAARNLFEDPQAGAADIVHGREVQDDVPVRLVDRLCKLALKIGCRPVGHAAFGRDDRDVIGLRPLYVEIPDNVVFPRHHKK